MGVTCVHKYVNRAWTLQTAKPSVQGVGLLCMDIDGKFAKTILKVEAI